MSFRKIFLILTTFSAPIIGASELKLVQVLCRHGDRAPDPGYQQWYPTDPHINQEYAPAGFGHLTEHGRNRSFQLGQYLRLRYSLPLKISEYSSSQFRVRSSDVDRCRQSADSIIAGLFPGSGPVPIYHQSLFKDPLFVGIHICPTIRTEMARVERSMRHLEEEPRWASLREYLTRHLGLNATRYHAFMLHQTLMAQRAFGLPLPEWTNAIYPSELERNAGYQYVLQSYNDKLKRINGGLWIREFTENMNNVASDKDGLKLMLYVGHETNLAGFLSALNIFKPHVPGFSSCLFLEMYRDSHSEEFYLRLFYKNYDKLEELHIPGCNTTCSLREFEHLTENLIPQNIHEECGLTS